MDKAQPVGEVLSKGKNDCKRGGNFYGLFLAPKTKICLTINKSSNLEEHETFKRFDDSKRLLDRSQYFKTIECRKISALLPKSWNKTFNNGIIIPAKKRFCNECNDKRTCNRCNIQKNENKEFEAIINLLKRQGPNQFGHILHSFEKTYLVSAFENDFMYVE